MLEKYGHGGDLQTAAELFGGRPDDFLDFSSNMNPLGPPQAVRAVIASYGERIAHYPDPASRKLTGLIARKHDVPESAVLVGNGAAELIDLAVRALRPATAAIPAPSFGEYGDAVRKAGGAVLPVRLAAERTFAIDADAVEAAERRYGRPSLWMIGSPNNPTGSVADPALIRRMVAGGHQVIVDEAFLDFVPAGEALSLIRDASRSPRLLVLRSMTKYYAVPGIRLGYAVGHPEQIAAMRALQVPWSVNSLAQAIGEAVLEQDDGYDEATAAWLRSERAYLTDGLQAVGMRVIPGQANYILFAVPPSRGLTTSSLQRAMGRRGVLIRDASRFDGLDDAWCRVAVRLRADNERLLDALRACMAEPGAAGRTAAGAREGKSE